MNWNLSKWLCISNVVSRLYKRLTDVQFKKKQINYALTILKTDAGLCSDLGLLYIGYWHLSSCITVVKNVYLSPFACPIAWRPSRRHANGFWSTWSPKLSVFSCSGWADKSWSRSNLWCYSTMSLQVTGLSLFLQPSVPPYSIVFAKLGYSSIWSHDSTKLSICVSLWLMVDHACIMPSRGNASFWKYRVCRAIKIPMFNWWLSFNDPSIFFRSVTQSQ